MQTGTMSASPRAVDENGNEVNGVGDQPNQHDILTGSDSTGLVPPGSAAAVTCNNWTSNDPANRTVVGHHDRLGGPERVVECRAQHRWLLARESRANGR